jgi:PD-(D/E)XK nuclease superfamily protein
MKGINWQGLLRLESELAKLSTFKNRPSFLSALGAVRSELKHSNFLAFLLDPSQKHDLKDRFLKALLAEINKHSKVRTEVLANLHTMDLTATAVYRERYGIDILLLNAHQRFAIIIENKTTTREHDDQLKRYWKTVTREYPWLSRQIGILLSVYERLPQTQSQRYVSISYGAICSAGEQLLRTVGNTVPDWTRNYLAEYISAIRREFVGDPNVLDLVWKISLQFKDELEFLDNNSPNQHIRQKLLSLIEGVSLLQVERDITNEVSFSLVDWSASQSLANRKQEPYKCRIVFWFHLSGDSVDLLLSPDPDARKVEDRLLSLFAKRPDAFQTREVFEREGWKVIWSRRFLSPDDFEKKTRGEIMKQLETRWHLFLHADLPRLRTVLAKEFLQ